MKTKIPFAIFSSGGWRLSGWWLVNTLDQPPTTQAPTTFLKHSRFVLQFLDQLRRVLRWRAFDDSRLFGFHRQVGGAERQLRRELGRVDAERGGVELFDLLLLRGHDPFERGVAQRVDARLNSQHRRRGHADPLKVSALKFAFDADAPVL